MGPSADVLVLTALNVTFLPFHFPFRPFRRHFPWACDRSRYQAKSVIMGTVDYNTRSVVQIDPPLW